MNIIRDITYLYKYNGFKFPNIFLEDKWHDTFVVYKEKTPNKTVEYWVNRRTILDHVNCVMSDNYCYFEEV